MLGAAFGKGYASRKASSCQRVAACGAPPVLQMFSTMLSGKTKGPSKELLTVLAAHAVQMPLALLSGHGRMLRTAADGSTLPSDAQRSAWKAITGLKLSRCRSFEMAQ